MNKILLTICVFPLMLGAVELHPLDDCETLKTNLKLNVVSPINEQLTRLEGQFIEATNSYVNVNNALADFRLRSRTSAYSDEVKAAYHYCAYESSLNPAMSSLGYMVSSVQNTLEFQRSYLSDASNIVNSIDCSQCPLGTDATNCCDFSSIISAINDVDSSVKSTANEISQILSNINIWLPRINGDIEVISNNINYGFLGVTNLMISINDSITNLFYGLNSVVSLGFENTTNILNSIHLSDSIGWGVSTNYFIDMITPHTAMYWANISPELGTSLRYPYYSSGNFINFRSGLGYFNNFAWQDSPMLYGIAPSVMLMMQELLGASYAQNSWTQYQHDYMYPPITNSLIQIHEDTTNFFSFFRGEIGVQGVLTDWTPQYGSYYDFLTNHYLAIMRGETLSANMSTKTNWFSRIETLLAALVFPDSPSTNVVDSSAYTEQQQAINSAISSVNSSASQSFRDFETSANSVISLYQMFAQNFDNVALPGRIVLFTLTNEDNSSEVIEFGFSDNPALTAFVEGCRAVSTFCWASVGIFLLFKFMVWALRGIYLTILFVYKVISAVLH